MSLFYKLAYWIGVKPWEEMAQLPIAEQISSLFDREERERQPPYGPVLDLGCGSGIWSVHLAARGWRVTGIDIVPRALRAARVRAREAGVEVQLIQGDMTALGSSGVGSGFRLVVDLGAIHGLTDAQRAAVAREIDAVTTDDATLLLLAWRPASRGPLPRGMSRDDIRTLFARWRLIDEVVADVEGAPRFVRNAEPRFYRLQRE